MNDMREDTSDSSSQDGGKEMDNTNRSRRRKRRRQVWAVEVSNVMPKTVQMKEELERFFINQVGINTGGRNLLSNSPVTSFYFEFRSEAQHQQAALKLDGSLVGGCAVRIRPWRMIDTADETHHVEDCDQPSPTSPHGISSGILKSDEKDDELGLSPSDIKSQEQQNQCIRNQAKRIKELEAKLKHQEDINAAKDKKIGNQRRTLVHVQAKLKAAAASNSQPQQEQPPQVHETRQDVTMGSIRNNESCGDECVYSETESPTLAAKNVEALKVGLADTIAVEDGEVEEKKKLQENDAELKQSAPEIPSQGQQEECIRNQAERIKDLEAKLKLQQLDNAAKKWKIGDLETALAKLDKEFKVSKTQQAQKIANQRKHLAGLHAKLKKLDPNAAAPNKHNQQNQSLKVHESRPDVATMPSGKDAPTLMANIEGLPVGVQEKLKLSQSQLQYVSREKDTLVKQLNDTIKENGSLRVDILGKELHRTTETFRKHLNNSIKHNGSLQVNFLSKEQAIKHQVDVVKTMLRRLRVQNKNLEKIKSRKGMELEGSGFKDNLEVAEQAIATLKGMIRKLNDEMVKVSANVDSNRQPLVARNVQEGHVPALETKGEVCGPPPQQNQPKAEKLEAKLVKALQDQNKLLEENQQLRRDKQGMQQTISTMKVHEAEIEQLREENEQLVEEVEQMRMNHAMEMGFADGGSGPSEAENMPWK